MNILDVDNLTANVASRICSTRPCDRILSTRNAQAKLLIKWTLLYRTQGSKVCACVTLQNCLIWVTNNHTVKAFNQRVSGGFHVLGKAQNSVVTQQDTRTCQSLNDLCVLKFSFFFPFPASVSIYRFMRTFKFSFAYVVRQRLFLSKRIGNEILRVEG